MIVEYLAEGGMGAIYLGKKLGVDGFEKEVVLKQLLPELTREPKFIDLFLREARLSASLDHNNIVRTVDLVNAGDDYFMVMEYVRGGDLRTLMRRARRRHKRFSPQAAAFIGHELLEALGYAHAKLGVDGKLLNLIHRDVSPSNILVSGAGEVKLTDFGIAKASTHASVFYKVKGKVGYMSPEQARGEPVDRRADLFALGVVLYEVLVGERLFVGDLLSTASMVYSQRITPPSRKRPDIPYDLDQVILKALSLEPDGRFQSAEAFQEALTTCASRNRLLMSASEMASHLKQVCGDDPGNWLKLETLGHSGFDESQALSTVGHGTAVLSSVEDDAVHDPFDDSEPHPARAMPQALLQKKELTSVIALRGDDIELISEESTGYPLEPLKPRHDSAPAISTPTPTPTSPFKPERDRRAPSFESEESQASRMATIVRTPVTSTAQVRPPARAQAQPQARPQSDPWNEPTRLPKQPPSKVLPEPGGGFESTDSVRKVRRRRRRQMVPVILVLLLIGIGVAVGVAFSGPELEVVDPVPAKPAPPAR